MRKSRYLGYFSDSTCTNLILVSDYSLYAVAVQTLVNPVSIREELTHDHWLSTAHAYERAAPPLIYQQSKIYHSGICFLLQVLTISEAQCLPVIRVLRRCLVFEATACDYWRLEAFGNENWILRIGYFDARRTGMEWGMRNMVLMIGMATVMSGHSPSMKARLISDTSSCCHAT